MTAGMQKFPDRRGGGGSVRQLSAGAQTAAISDDVVKIGVLTDMSGQFSHESGEGAVTADQDGRGGFRRQGAGQADRGRRRRSSKQA